MKSWHTSLTLLTLSCALTGCSRFREMTRNDYALSRDPFATSLAGTDETEQPPVPGMAPSESGFVRIGGPPDTPREAVVADYGSTDPSPESNIMTASATTGRNAPLGDNPFAATATDQNQKVTTVSLEEDALDGFAEFAAQRTQEWDQQVQTVKRATDVASQVEDELAGFSEDSLISAAVPPDSPFGDSRADDVAVPLIDQRSAERDSASAPRPERSASELAGPVGPGMIKQKELSPFRKFDAARQVTSVPEPVFDAPASDSGAVPPNPFADLEAEAEEDASPAAESGKPLDAEFGFDSGWRPAGVMRP